MMSEITDPQPPAIALWFRELLRGPVIPSGDYFDRLREMTESSAPVFDGYTVAYQKSESDYQRCGC